MKHTIYYSKRDAPPPTWYTLQPVHTEPFPRPTSRLFILNTTTSGLLSSLNSLLVLSSRGTSLQAGHESGRGLEWSLEVSARRLSEEVNLDLVALECTLEWDNGLDQ